MNRISPELIDDFDDCSMKTTYQPIISVCLIVEA